MAMKSLIKKLQLIIYSLKPIEAVAQEKALHQALIRAFSSSNAFKSSNT